MTLRVLRVRVAIANNIFVFVCNFHPIRTAKKEKDAP